MLFRSKHALAPGLVAALAGRPFALVANLPYQAATPLMATLLEHHPECRGQFVTIQREVGDRLMAKAGTDAYGPISVTMSLLADVEQVAVLPPGCFWPAPKVTSAMIAMRKAARKLNALTARSTPRSTATKTRCGSTTIRPAVASRAAIVAAITRSIRSLPRAMSRMPSMIGPPCSASTSRKAGRRTTPQRVRRPNTRGAGRVRHRR